MTRALSALVITFGLLLSGGCSSDETGDSVTDNQVDEKPGQDGDKVEESPAP